LKRFGYRFNFFTMTKRATSERSQENADDVATRLAALSRFIDWAEREALSLNATDCGTCLQLARVALRSAPQRSAPDRH
jgi:hypothetical protein